MYIHNGPTAGLQAHTEVLAYRVGNIPVWMDGDGRRGWQLVGVLMDNKKGGYVPSNIS